MKHALVATVLLAALATAPGGARAAPFAYVPNEGSGTLSVIDTATDQVVGEIAAGKKPRGIVVSADGRTVYVSDQPNNQLVVVDIGSRKATGVIALGESPRWHDDRLWFAHWGTGGCSAVRSS